MSTAEVTEHFDATRPTVLKRLEALKEEGGVRSKKIGTSKAWYDPRRENYRLIRFVADAGVSRAELNELLDRHGAERLEEVAEILKKHDEINDADLEVLDTAASALAQGRDREQVVRT